MSDPLDKIFHSLRKVEAIKGTIVKDSQQIGNAKSKIEPTLSQRLAANSEEALTQMRLEKAKQLTPVDEIGTDAELNDIDEMIVDRYLSQIINRCFE